MFNKEEIRKKLEEKTPAICRLRRIFHRIPEPGFREILTTKEICRQLRQMGIAPVELNPTGVTAYLGPEEGYTIALRSDIDGLQVEEGTGLPFRSEHPGWMHACGHDGHIASLLGAASILKEVEDRLTVRVKLIFQPAEETAQGAKQLLEQGVLGGVDEVFGLHLFSDMKIGAVSLRPGPVMAQTDRFFITFHGRGGHAGKPHQCVDATVMGADFVMSAQTIVAREIDPLEGAVVTIGVLHSGSQYNVISGEAKVEGTCRSFSEETAARLKKALEERARSIAGYYGGEAEIEYELGSHPPVINDRDMTARIAGQAAILLENAALQKAPPLMLGEDFSWYQTQAPGTFAFVGCGKAGAENCFPNHHPKFDMDESALPLAAGLHLAAVRAAMEKEEG